MPICENEWRDPKDLLVLTKKGVSLIINTDRGERKGDLWFCPLMKCPVITSGPSSYFFYHIKFNNCVHDENDLKKFVDYDRGPRCEVLGWKYNLESDCTSEMIEHYEKEIKEWNL